MNSEVNQFKVYRYQTKSRSSVCYTMRRVQDVEKYDSCRVFQFPDFVCAINFLRNIKKHYSSAVVVMPLPPYEPKILSW